MYAHSALVFSCMLHLLTSTTCQNGDHERHGHLQPFGTGPSVEIEEIQGFLDTKHFFSNYAWQSKPLKMSAAIADSAAVRLWSDEYFLSLDVPHDYEVLVETKKKENRKQDTLMLHFHEFVRTYNTSECYMVETVPPFLGADLPLPYPLQCEQIYRDKISETLMWFSSGGTKSVVHTDSVDNINCLVRGEKQFVMVNPHKYAHQVDIDHPSGAYSGMDVDRVDYDSYPGMEGVEFYHVHLTAGDCLYIPYKWIHQVRSFERNIAVNLWWDHYATADLDITQCTGTGDPHFTLADVTLSVNKKSVGEIKDFLLDLAQKRPIEFDVFHDVIVGDIPLDELDAGGGYRKPLLKILEILDTNSNELIEQQEIEQLADQDWDLVLDQMDWFDDIVQALEERWNELHAPADLYADLDNDDVTAQEFYDPTTHDEF